MARAGQCICRREPAGRRPVWARWHEAAQTATKQRTWDDFIAFAEDLIRRKVTSPRRWAWSAAATEVCWCTAITQRRDRFNAAIVQVALFDMFRFTKFAQAPPTSANTAIPPSRAARLDRDQLTLSEACPGQDLPGPVHSHFQQGRSRASGPRPQGSRRACCARQPH
ncbi:S9 family peptidase [Bradyrhizobium sp. 146]|nr:S9 family peptidase [Bradyrhizobium sp. CW11]MCK1704654.1 S9 family peptidase [Bradyrhizobium sp. 146]